MFYEETTYIYEQEDIYVPENLAGNSNQADLKNKGDKTKQSLNERIHLSNNQTGLDEETLLQSSREQ